MYQIVVDWAPTYELSVSLATLFSKTPKTLDVGADWVKSMRERGGATFAALADLPKDQGQWIDILIWRCLAERDAESFLRWLAETPVGSLYELLAPFADEAARPLPSNLRALRDTFVVALSAWNDLYFRDIDPAILRGLAAEAERLRQDVAQSAPEDVVERATGGVRFDAPPGIDHVVLIPQYHYRPINLYARVRGHYLLLYPVDVLPPAPGQPPQRLMRLTRALDDESRLRILRLLSGGAHTFTSLVAQTGLAKSTVHHHMIVLRAAGLVLVHDTGSGADSYELRRSSLTDLATQLEVFLKED
jgi:DNA-binding transcriptional ArsR family regulator